MRGVTFQSLMAEDRGSLPNCLDAFDVRFRVKSGRMRRSR